MAWDNQGSNRRTVKGLPTPRKARGIPSYLGDQRQQQIEDRRRQQQARQDQQRQAIQDQQANRARQQQMQQRQNVQDQQAMNAQATSAPASLWNQFLAWTRGTPYQGLTNQYGQPLIPDYTTPQGVMDAWGVNQPYQPQLATSAHNVEQLMNPNTMAAWRNRGIINNPSRKKVVNTSMYSTFAPSVPLPEDNGGGGGGWQDWGGGGGGGGWNDNYIATWYNSLVRWTFGNEAE